MRLKFSIYILAFFAFAWLSACGNDDGPKYEWHTFFGSEDVDEGYSVAIDGSGSIYIAGNSSSSWNGPGGQSPLNAYFEDDLYAHLFVLKLDPNGAYLWHTFYGSSGNQVYSTPSLAIDGSGNLYISGTSYASWNGPDGQSPLNIHSEDDDIFVLKLDSNGAYQWHTFYGIEDKEGASALAIDASGNIFVTGSSNSSWNGPNGQLPLNAHSVGIDVFVLKLDPNGAYQWHTFYGANGESRGYSLDVDESGDIYVTGYSVSSWNGPDGQPPLNANSGGIDAFVLKMKD
jgi:hypothetical protein